MFSQFTAGYGVISAKKVDGGTMPSYYLFGGGGLGSPFAKNDLYSVILLFMSKEAVSAFEKGAVRFQNDRIAVAGPVGSINDTQKKEIESVQILAYAYFNGTLKGVTFKKSFWKNFYVNPDNNINQPLYGMKGKEVITSTKIEKTSIPVGIYAFQTALEKYYGIEKKN